MTSARAICTAFWFAGLMFAATFAWTWIVRRKWSYVSFSPHRFVHNLATDKFDMTQEEIPFEPRLERYTKTAEVVITLASASLVFLPNVHVGKPSAWLAFAMTLLGLCVLLALLFMVSLIFFYEDSLYFPMHYTVPKSALVSALGFTSLICFGAAYLAVAIKVAFTVGSQ